MKTPFLLFTATFAALSAPLQAQNFDWQKTNAKVLPNGDLQPAPLPFQFKPGAQIRYIDFQNGDDAAAGTNKTAPWKHHPWDETATGNAKNSRGAVTYVFKRGTIYRGALRPKDDAGAAGNPIQLTSDPSWGTGEAAIYGSETVSGWTKGAHPKMPDGEKVWSANVGFLPRTLWMTGKNGEITRLKLARHPNWEESDPNDVMSQWPTWENPEWWKNGNRGHLMKVDGKDKHLGIDKKNLTGAAEDYVGGTVWSEWGIVMGSPYPAKIEAFDAEKKGVAFRGPWTYDALESIIAGNRYYLEDRPQWLDEGGEFWVERAGQGGTVFLRLPAEVDPNSITIEAGKQVNILDAAKLEHVHISGLTFRFSNVHWDYNIPCWGHPDVMAGVIRLNGSGDDIEIRNCAFEHVNLPVRFNVKSVSDQIGSVRVLDNVMRFTDHGAITIAAAFGGREETKIGRLGSVELLRNQLQHIGWRIVSGEHGHAIDIRFPTTSHISGNFLHRIAGWGICVFGGKPSGAAGAETPFFRNIIHHNRVEDVLLKSNDWGGIETWQGGPHYVFNNIVINPVGFKNWIFAQNNKDQAAAFGHAYYLDGGYKNFYFNNIAQGKNNELGTKSVNVSGLQGILGFENTFFHNTFTRFAAGVRQQAPEAGRLRFFSNVFDDISQSGLRLADPKKGTPDPNASHYTQGGLFDYPTLAFRDNVFHNIRGSFGVFEETGASYKTLEEMKTALEKSRVSASELGVTAEKSPLRDAQKGDFRPAAGSPAQNRGSKVWVPWSLYGVAGEWNFTLNNADASKIEDEGWQMTANYGDRTTYKNTPRYPLRGQNIGATDFGAGQLEDWANGALKLNGKDQFLSLAKADILPPVPAPEPNQTVENEFATITLPARVTPGSSFDVVVALKPAFATQKPRADLHWLKKQGFGGFMASGGTGTPVADSGAVKFTLKAASRGELSAYSVLVYASSTGDWKDKTQSASVKVEPTQGAVLDPAKARTVDMAENNFLIETVIQTSAVSGLIAGKSDGKTGYTLDLVNGKPRLSLNGGAFSATANLAVNDGKWRHLIAEVDRKTGVIFYLDGKNLSAQTTGVLPTTSLSNAADFQVGGGPNQTPLAASLDFLRVARGTLADAQTSIGELYVWQFGGPQFRDFAGTARTDKNNAAGALVGG